MNLSCLLTVCLSQESDDSKYGFWLPRRLSMVGNQPGLVYLSTLDDSVLTRLVQDEKKVITRDLSKVASL